ncbi:hypothetical protein HMPREF1987_01965 [Peptostreptococcaceae bacterium oral taxon 113 str. W5053]|nr:hypothetical protein HMPREF1987_01965 [Peptostreptococcaceae bacterium oral taxon 113 str. W5053]
MYLSKTKIAELEEILQLYYLSKKKQEFLSEYKDSCFKNSFVSAFNSISMIFILFFRYRKSHHA